MSQFKTMYPHINLYMYSWWTGHCPCYMSGLTFLSWNLFFYITLWVFFSVCFYSVLNKNNANVFCTKMHHLLLLLSLFSFNVFAFHASFSYICLTSGFTNQRAQGLFQIDWKGFVSNNYHHIRWCIMWTVLVEIHKFLSSAMCHDDCDILTLLAKWYMWRKCFSIIIQYYYCISLL